jgi:hypothetical protein
MGGDGKTIEGKDEEKFQHCLYGQFYIAHIFLSLAR